MAENQVLTEDEERRIIVDKYEKGREKILDQIDDWEDPNNEIFHTTDRYGFIHDHRLSDKLTDYESKIRTLEASRSDKWVKMIKEWDKYYPTGKIEKLRQRIYKGIPNQIRGMAWCRLLGVSQVKDEQSGRYNEMLKFGLLYSQDVRQIDLDVNRTFRNNVMFRERYNTKQQELFRVLTAYSVYNSEIGYCQGMSQIAALLLMYTTEEDAFWALDRLMSSDRYAMHGFFIPGFPKLNRFARHHDLVLRRYLPKVYKHFKKFDIDSTLYTLKWFFQCFLDRVPFSLTLRLWDVFILEGEVVLTCMSYTLLKLHKKTILRKGMEDLIEFLQVELEKDFGYHDDQAITALQQSISELRRHKMELPKEAPADNEKPTKPFGFLLEMDNLSVITGDDRSLAGSIIIRPSDVASLAQTSRTGSEVDMRDLENENEQLNNVEVNDFCKMQRSLSLYDNVDIIESIEAAKRLSGGAYDPKGKNGSQKSPNETKWQISNSLDFLKTTDTPTPSPSSEHKFNNFSQYTKNVDEHRKSMETITPTPTMENVEAIEMGQLNSSNSLSYIKNDRIEFIDASGDSLSAHHNFECTFPSENKSLVESSATYTIQNTSNSDVNVCTVEHESTIYAFDKSFGEVCETNDVTDRSIQHSSTPIDPVYNSFSNDTDLSDFQSEMRAQRPTSLSQNDTPSRFVRKTSIPKLVKKRSPESKNGTAVKEPIPVTSPTSPISPPSLIPRYVTRSPSSVSPVSPVSPSSSKPIPNQRMHSNGNTVIHNVNSAESPTPTNNEQNNLEQSGGKVRIYVPYGRQGLSTNDSNKIRIRVNSPKQDELKNRSKAPLPTIDT